jgi:hypothetical protein
MVATLNPDLLINVEIVEPVYEKDPDEHGYYDNKMVSTTPVGMKEIKISANGKITASEEELLTAS